MPDSTPNYLSIDGSGLVTATFTGGLILPTSETTVSPGVFNKVKWIRDTTLQYISEVSSAWSSASQINELLLRVISPSGARELKLFLDASDNAGSKSRISAYVAGNQVEILREDAKSGFLQVSGGTVSGTVARSAVRMITFTWPGGSCQSNPISLSGSFGFNVSGILGGRQNPLGMGFLAEPAANIPGDFLVAYAYDGNGSPALPSNGQQQAAVVCAIQGTI